MKKKSIKETIEDDAYVLIGCHSTFTVIGALVLLKTMGNSSAVLIWNSIHYWLAHEVLPDYDQLQRKFYAAEGNQNDKFWCWTTDDRLIETSWSNPKSFYAPDYDAAIDYSDKVLGIAPK